jgi:SAM-dependent methyltransferase
MLHVAPEECFLDRFPKIIGSGYVSADLASPFAMVRMDITRIAYPDEYFDAIYCSHVLEHVEDDRRAMREFHRVLRKDGWAILNVPITAPATFEDPSIISPAARLAAFGQEDHVRRYGPDYIDRLREAGFGVDVFSAADIASPEECIRMGLTAATGALYFCRK